MSSTIQVYRDSRDVPQTVIRALERNEINANCILPILLKSRVAQGQGEHPPREQVWITCTSPNGDVELVLSVTEGYIDSYPVFLCATVAAPESYFQPRLQGMVVTLHGIVPVGRIYSVFGPDALARIFALVWTEITGIRSYWDKPYYASKLSYCTRQTFIDSPISMRPDLIYEIRPANPSDIPELAVQCYGFAGESDPFFLTPEGAMRESTFLVHSNQVWVHRIAERGKPQQSEIASIVAFTRNSSTNATITKVYTNPNWRRLGCAERLVREVCKHLLQEKLTITLFVGRDNPAAHVYSRVGFVGLNPQEGAVHGVEDWTEIGFDRRFVRLGHW